MRFFLMSFLFFIFSLLPAKAENNSNSVVRVYVTAQGYDYVSPWQKNAIQKRILSGFVIKGNRILTGANKLTDHILVEVSKNGSEEKFPAEIVLKDYNCGISILEVNDKTFFKDLKPLNTDGDVNFQGTKGIITRWDDRGIIKNHTAEYIKSSIQFFQAYSAVLIHNVSADIDADDVEGAPFFIDGVPAGMASWYDEDKLTCGVIALDVINRVLKDLDVGEYEGMPYFYIKDEFLRSDTNIREYLGMEKSDTGVLINDVPSGSSGSGVLKKGDVILSINDTNIDDNGLYTSVRYGMLSYYGLIFLNHYVGDTLKMSIVRERKKMDVSIKLKPFSRECFLIPSLTNGEPPKYFITGGIILQEFTRNYLRTWGNKWVEKSDKRLMYYFENFTEYPSESRKGIVILSKVLPAAVNTGYHDMSNLILNSVNGVPVRDINHVKEIIDKTTDRFIKLDFVGNEYIILDAEKVRISEKEILKKYNIPKPYYLGE